MKRIRVCYLTGDRSLCEPGLNLITMAHLLRVLNHRAIERSADGVSSTQDTQRTQAVQQLDLIGQLQALLLQALFHCPVQALLKLLLACLTQLDDAFRVLAQQGLSLLIQPSLSLLLLLLPGASQA